MITFVTVLISICACYISYLQYKLAKIKQHSDQYEKKMRVYSACRKASRIIKENYGQAPIDILSNFYEETADSDFVLTERSNNFVQEYADALSWNLVRTIAEKNGDQDHIKKDERMWKSLTRLQKLN